MSRQWIVARTDTSVTRLKELGAVPHSLETKEETRVVYFRPSVNTQGEGGRRGSEGLWLDYLLLSGEPEAINELPVRVVCFGGEPATLPDSVVEYWNQVVEHIYAERDERKDARSWARKHRGALARVVGGALQGTRGTIGEMSGEHSVYLETDFTSKVSVKIGDLEITP